MKGAGSSSEAGGSSSAGGSSLSCAAKEENVAGTALDDEEAMGRTENFLGVHPVRLVDDIYNFVTVYIKRSVDMLEAALMDDSETRGSAIEVAQGCAGCQSRLVSSLDRNVDKFELYVVRNCLRVPAHIDDSSALAIASAGNVGAGGEGSATAEEEAALNEEVAALRRKVQSAVFLNRAMKSRIEAYDSLLSDCAAVGSCLEEADRRVAEHGVGALGEAALRVLQMGRDVESLEKQYTSLDEQHAAGENAPPAPPPEGALAACRGALGFASTRELKALGGMLGA